MLRGPVLWGGRCGGAGGSVWWRVRGAESARRVFLVAGRELALLSACRRSLEATGDSGVGSWRGRAGLVSAAALARLPDKITALPLRYFLRSCWHVDAVLEMAWKVRRRSCSHPALADLGSEFWSTSPVERYICGDDCSVALWRRGRTRPVIWVRVICVLAREVVCEPSST